MKYVLQQSFFCLCHWNIVVTFYLLSLLSKIIIYLCTYKAEQNKKGLSFQSLFRVSTQVTPKCEIFVRFKRCYPRIRSFFRVMLLLAFLSGVILLQGGMGSNIISECFDSGVTLLQEGF